jgi:hypothetical protein
MQFGDTAEFNSALQGLRCPPLAIASPKASVVDGRGEFGLSLPSPVAVPTGPAMDSLWPKYRSKSQTSLLFRRGFKPRARRC